jgi:hypothetical protein
MAGEISNHSISDIAGLVEPLSPIVPTPHSLPMSAFSPFPYRHHNHGNLQTDIQHLIAADDTENDKLRMVSSISINIISIAFRIFCFSSIIAIEHYT